MRHSSTARRFSLAAVAALAVPLAQHSGANAGGAGGPLRDGNWAGSMAVGATVDFSSGSTAVIASGSGNGTFNLTLNAGVATGDYTLGFFGQSDLESQGGSGHADALGAITGSVAGGANLPALNPGSAHVDVSGEVTVNGVTVPFNEGLDFGPEDMITSNLVITSSSCTYASGTWAQEFKEAIQAAGGAISKFSGSWAATFKGTNPGAADQTLENLLASGELILSQWFDTGNFDAETLEEVLLDAESYAASGPKNDACGGGKGQWASPLAGMVQRLLIAVANSGATTPEILSYGIAAGLRTNVLPSIDDPLEGELMTKAQELLDLAVSGGVKSDIFIIGTSANAMGWTDLYTQATTALAGLS